MFWGARTLGTRLSRENPIEPFCEKRIEGAAYQLAIGDEIYVSPTADATDPSTTSIVPLKKRQAFVIPPGQFAFLLTGEKVKVGVRQLAFISIRAKVKFRGLVNVSGFHVDPGFEGHLNFAVFNAGPVAVHLRQGDPIFLIWYADLTDCGTPRRGQPSGIQSEWISGISGELHSLASLANSVTGVEQRLDKRLDAVTRELVIFRFVAATAVGVGIGLLVRLLLQS